jgi:putative flippase GtrA
MRRLSRYLVVSAMGAVVQLTAVWALTAIGRVSASTAAGIAVAAAALHNFFWHCLWTWADRPRRGRATLEALAAYALSNGVISGVGNVVAVRVLVDWGGWHPVAACGLAIATCGAINFWIAGRGVWRHGNLPSVSFDAYSTLSALSGSTRAARNAGTAAAVQATTRNAAVAVANVAGSRGERP